MKKVSYLSGGVGGAKFAKGLYQIKNIDLNIIVNTGDDEVINGVFLSPDIDTVIYNLAGIEGKFGWGIKNDKFTVHNHLNKFLKSNFMIGDKDLAQAEESAKNIDILGLILARPVPAFAELSTLAAGMIKMPFKKFFYVIVITNIGVAIIFSGLGAAALSNESSTIAFFGVAILPAILYTFYKKYIKWLRVF